MEWGTPPDLKEALDKEFAFDLDPCKPGEVWDGTEIPSMLVIYKLNVKQPCS